jgi:hypothetical protein
MGINGVIFDPALDPFIQSIFMTGTAGAVRIPVIYVELQEP